MSGGEGLGAAGSTAGGLVRILGPIVVGDGAPLKGRQAVLTGLLALAAPDPVRAHELLAAVYPDRLDAALPDLRVLISRLRRALREAGSDATVIHGTGGYHLHGAEVDAARFEALGAEVLRIVSLDPARAARLAGEALQLWRGEIGPPELAEHPAAVRLRELRLSVLCARYRALAADGQEAGWLPDLLLACRTYPYVEELWSLAMTAMYRVGRQREALELYREVRNRLAEELGVEPGPVLREAEAAILQQRVPPPRRRAALDAGRSGGFRRYADRYLATGAGPALLEAVAHHRLLTVVGAAGMGKTRLVCETLPAAAARRWPDGALFCSLSELAAGAPVAPTVAELASVRVPPGAPAADVLVAEWRRHRRLVVLDTCEHVLDGAASLAAALLRDCPDVTVVATSRAPLRVSGEQVWPMPPMPLPIAVELFVDRAERANPAFDAGAAGRPVIDRLCAGLDVLPLAIELAANRVRALSPQELLDRLDRRFPLLRVGDGTPEGGDGGRHASLEAALDWSYRSLGPGQQLAFRVLGAFHTEVELELFEELAADHLSDPAASLADLVDHCLVVATAHGGSTHYTMLDSVRAYARIRLDEAGERDRLAGRHAQLICSRKDAAVRRCRGPEEPEGVAALERLWPELRAAVAWCSVRGEVALLFELVAGLAEAAMLRERTEVGDWLGLALDAQAADADVTVADASRATALAAGALSDWCSARFERGLARAEEAYTQSRCATVGDPMAILVSLALHRGVLDPSSFVGLCLRLAAEDDRRGDHLTRSWLLSGAAMGHAYVGEVDEAVALCDRADRLARLTGSPSRVALCLFARTIALVDADPTAAIACADRTLAVAASVNATWLTGNTPNYRSAALIGAGRLDEAQRETVATLHRLRAGGSRQSATNTLRNAVALLERRRDDEATALVAGWLLTGRGVPGTPGMRARVDAARERLDGRGLGELLEVGAGLALSGVVDVALAALEGC
ncbi:MAG: BTAD domain-containing putative transcriptional regulator [Acidimicrobiia bacterium]